MLNTTLSEGRKIGPAGSYFQRRCEANSNSNLAWPSSVPTTPSLVSLQASLPSSALSPATQAPATGINLQLESASLHYSASLKTRTSCEVTESLFASGGYNTPPISSPYLSASPYELATKDYHQSIAFSQANSIFVQSQTDFVTGTSSISKKTATCFGRWEHTLEPLHIQVPPFQSVSSLSVKTEGISCGSSQGSKFENLTPQSASHSHHLQSNGDCINSCGFVTTMTTSSPQTTSIPSSNDITNGCSRTIPISWSSSSTSSTNTAPSSTSALLGGTGSGFSSPFPDNQNPQQQNAASSSTSSSTSSSVTLLQIKREPCQVSEVTTSNNLGHHHHSHRSASSLTAVVKLESSSPKSTVMDNQPMSASQNPANAIPVGIAVARQRLQEHTTVAHQPKESNRFGIGIADIGGATSSINSQNMFFAGTNSTMIPFNSDALNMGASNVQNAVRTPPTFWQYPTPVPVESMLPMPIPPVGFQLVRDPNTGQFLFLPATTATIEPFQPAVVWPTYPQPTTAIQPPHLLLPPITQSLQPPPLAPLQLLGSDYLATASTTLHQHTQTHSTRFVALTADAKRKHVTGPTIPLPIPQHTVIKIEDCSSGNATSAGTSTTHHQSTIYDDEKTGTSMHASAATITTAVQTNDVGGNIPQLYYHPPPTGLIQIAPQHTQNSIQECRSVVGNASSPSLIVPPSLPTSSPKITTCLHSPNSDPVVPENLEAATSCVPEVQDATIQTDTPVMSEDDNTVGAEECSLPEPPDEIRDGVIHSTSLTQPQSSSSPVCHNAEEKVDFQESSQKETDLSKTDSGFDSNAVSSTMSVEEPQSSISEKWNCTNLNVRTEIEAPNTRIASPELNPEKELQFKGMGKVTSTPVDLSGLELLSNISIEAIEKKIEFIKQEPIEDKKIVLPDNSGVSPEENEIRDDKNIDLSSDKFVNHEQLGGLNLLCALAEQRIQEEVGQRHRKRSSSSSESYSSKKKKHKHSKSSKKSKHDKDKREKKRSRKENEEETKQENFNDDGLDNDIKETFKRVTAKYTKCASCKTETSHCCKEKCGWPTAEEFVMAMETDMRLRLADITRQCQEKQKELEEMSPLLHQRKQQLSDGESTPLSSKSSVRSYHLEKQMAPSTSLSSTLLVPMEPNQDLDVSKASSDTESGRFDDIETSSVSSSKRKAGNPRKQDETNTEMIVAKKPKTLVGYILASKNRSSTETIKDKNLSDNQGFLTDETTIFSESSCKANRISDVKLEADIKEEPAEEDTSKQDLEKFSVPCEESSFYSEKRFHRKSSKHHSKHKKSKSSRERKHREIEKRKMKIDSSCVLTFEHLDKGKTRVLTAMAGLFYAGTLSPVQPPDIYAVTLDGERNNKPHIMSREEVLRDAILEVSPTSIEDIPTGTRICAYWSQQYRCLYPGTVAEPGTPDTSTDKKFVCVEFDDGDSGRIALEDIRFLLSDYPIVEYDPNPLLSLGKRKRRTSQNHTETTQKSEIVACNSSNCFGMVDDKTKIKSTIEQANYKERKKLKKMKKERHKKSELSDQNESAFEKKHKKKHKCNEEFCKHRKHKKRKKHKKHHRRENLQIADSSQDADFSQCNSPVPIVSCAETITPAPPAQIENENPPIEVVASKDPKKEAEESTFDPNVKEDTMMEEEVASSTTESSGSIYEPKRKKERQNSADNHSKIAAFLPARQLWAWAGKGHKRSVKGRARKQFYKAIQRGKETILVGDSAVFLSTGRPDRPYIGKIESMWETSSSNKVVRVKWFYHPEETVGCPNLKYPGALFESPHADENDVQTISHKCEVLSLEAYTKKFGPDLKQYENIYDNNDTYYLAGYYDPTIQNLKLQPDIPALSEGTWS